MNILFIKYFFVGFMVSEIHRESRHCPYSVTFLLNSNLKNWIITSIITNGKIIDIYSVVQFSMYSL